MQFAALGAWQLGRGLDKRAHRELYLDDSRYQRWRPGADVRPFGRLEVTGYLDGDRQFLLDNVVVDGRIGYYVLTPLRTDAGGAVVLINRGWLAREEAGAIAVPDRRVTLRGRAGSLPRAGFRMGDPILPGSPWPKVAVYPERRDIAAELGEEPQDFVLLLDPDDEHGYLRRWEPDELGPGRHFAYAAQWFAMGAALAALLAWNFRRGRSIHE